MTTIDAGSAAAAGTQVIGARVERAERLSGSVGNFDFMLVTSVGDFVLKASPTQDLAAEVWACERVRRVGVLAPEVVWFKREPHSLPVPFLVMRRVPGAPLENVSPALRVAGQQLAMVHSVRLPGYGGLIVEGSRAKGRHDRWDAFVRELAAGLDWGDACAGDPRLDLARMSMAGPRAFAEFMSGYGLPVTPELNRSLTAYRLLWLLDALTYEFRAGGDWFDSYRAGIRAAVADLTR